MPTVYCNQLTVEGSARSLAAFTRDHNRWRIEPWASLFSVDVTGDANSGQLVYLYNEDFKRPSPSVAEMSADFPDLAFVHEYADEFGQVAMRHHYKDGVEVSSEELDPLSLEWMEWEEDEG